MISYFIFERLRNNCIKVCGIFTVLMSLTACGGGPGELSHSLYQPFNQQQQQQQQQQQNPNPAVVPDPPLPTTESPPDTDSTSIDPLSKIQKLSTPADIRPTICATFLGDRFLCGYTQIQIPGLLQFHAENRAFTSNTDDTDNYLIIIDSTLSNHGDKMQRVSQIVANGSKIYKHDPDNDDFYTPESGETIRYILSDNLQIGQVWPLYLTAEEGDIVNMSLNPILRYNSDRVLHNLNTTQALLVLSTGNDGWEQPRQTCQIYEATEQRCPQDRDAHLLAAGETGLLLLVTGYELPEDVRWVYDLQGNFLRWDRHLGNGRTEELSTSDVPLSRYQSDGREVGANACGVAKDFCLAAAWNIATEVVERTDSELRYTSTNGTSVSTALVSSTLALVKEQWPTLSAYDLRDIALSCAIDVGEEGVDEVFGHGILSIGCVFKPIETLTVSSRTVSGGILIPGVSGTEQLTAYDSFNRDFAISFTQEKRDVAVLPGGMLLSQLLQNTEQNKTGLQSFLLNVESAFTSEESSSSLRSGLAWNTELGTPFIHVGRDRFPVSVGYTTQWTLNPYITVLPWLSYGIEEGFFGGTGVGSFALKPTSHIQAGISFDFTATQNVVLTSWALVDQGWSEGNGGSLVDTLSGYEVRAGLRASYQNTTLPLTISAEITGSTGLHGNLYLKEDLGTYRLKDNPQFAVSVKFNFAF